MEALVLGGTGLVGKDVVNLLLEDKRYEKVTSLVRRELPLEHKKLHQVQIDFSRMNQWAENFCASHLFCCLGTTIKKAKSKEKFEEVDYKYVIQAAKLLKEKGSVKRPELLGELQSVVKTKQRGGVNRILAYYQGLLERRGVLELRKKPD